MSTGGRFNGCFGRLYSLFCCATILFLIFLFIYYLIVVPRSLEFYISDASLTQFNYNPTNYTLLYNLSLIVTIKNPNKNIKIRYNYIGVEANYVKATISLGNFTSIPFNQGFKNTTILHEKFQGKELVIFKEGELSKYSEDTSASLYDIHLKLILEIKVKFGLMKLGMFHRPDVIDCTLKVPLLHDSNTTSSPSSNTKFKTIMCNNI